MIKFNNNLFNFSLVTLVLELSQHSYKRFESSRLLNYKNSKLKKKQRKPKSMHVFGVTNTCSLKVTLSEVTCAIRSTRLFLDIEIH